MKAYRASSSPKWALAVLEADALELIESSADRLKFYEEILLPAIRSKIAPIIPDKNDNNNNNLVSSTMQTTLQCPLVEKVHSQPIPRITHIDKFNEILQRIYDRMFVHVIARKIKTEAKYTLKTETKHTIKTEIMKGQSLENVEATQNPPICKIKPKRKSEIKKEKDEKIAITKQIKQEQLDDNKRRCDEIVQECKIASPYELFYDIVWLSVCEICLDGNGKIYKCSDSCHRSHHEACIAKTPCQNCGEPQRQNCFTCNNNGCIPKKKRMHCIHCSAIYHFDSKCIPAGATILSRSQLICPRHHSEKTKVSFNQCSICAHGKQLLSCLSCPAVFHSKCIGDPVDTKSIVCARCRLGVLPVYGEIVWVKYHQFAWWPGLLNTNIIEMLYFASLVSRYIRDKLIFP